MSPSGPKTVAALLVVTLLARGDVGRPACRAQAAEAASPRPEAEPTAVRLVSAAKYRTLAEAVARERYLYIPPGRYEVKEPIPLGNRRGGVILGSGRFTTILHAPGGQPVFRVSACTDLLLGHLTIETQAQRESECALEVTGKEGCKLTLTGVVFEAGTINKAGDKNGGTALRLAAPGDYLVQGCHFAHCAVGLEAAHSGAVVSVLGGNFQSNRLHVRQSAGRLELRSAGLQVAVGGVDVEIRTASADGPHVVEGCRSEGPDTLLHVPRTRQRVDLALKANSAHAARLALYEACGTLVLAGNNMDLQRSRTGVEAPAPEGACRIISLGNCLGNSFDAGGAFVLGPRAGAVSVGDLWNAAKPQAAYVEPANRIVSPQAYREADRKLPDGLTFPEHCPDVRLLTVGRRPQPVQIPRLTNLEELVPSVKKYGATGDGKTDDSAALQKAVEQERHKPLYFPAGRYLVSDPLLLHHWRGATFWGDGSERSVLVSSTDRSALRTNSCGYAAFVDLGFETAPGATATAFDLDWDNSSAADAGGAALQANLFYRCRFEGGATGLDIGRQGYMGSENLLVGCLFRRSGAGVGIGNYNALSNTLLGCTFADLDFGVRHSYGSFNLYGSELQGIRRAGAQLGNSAADTFVFSQLRVEGERRLVETGHTGAAINVLVQACRLGAAAEKSNDPFINYAAGGAFVVLDCDLGDRRVNFGGNIANSTLVVIGGRMEQPKVDVGGRAKMFLPPPR